MAASDGHIEFEDANANKIDMPVPSFPYKTIIDLPFEWQKQDDGTWGGYDHGTDYDKRSCQCTFFYDVTDIQTFNNFFRTDGQGRGRDVTMRMNANSGFFPFGADKGDVGDFTVALTIKKHGTVGEAPFRYFKFEVIIHNTGTWPAYTPPAEVSEGNFTIGTIINLRFPPRWFQPKIEYGEFVTIEQDSGSQWIDRSINYDWYETAFNMVCNESKAAALIAYLVNTARTNNFVVIPPTDSYMFGRDYGSTNNYTVQMIQDKITITNDVNNRHSFGLNLSLVSSMLNGTINLGGIEPTSPVAKLAIDTTNNIIIAAAEANQVNLYTYNPTTGAVSGIIDTINPDAATELSVTIHVGIGSLLGVAIIGAAGAGNVYSYPYNTAGFGAQIDSVNFADGVNDLTIDTVNRIFYGAVDIFGITSGSYDANGDNLVRVEGIAQGYGSESVAFDSVNINVFAGNSIILNSNVSSYTTDATGDMTPVNTIKYASGRGNGIDVDGTNGIVILGNDVRGLDSLSFNAGVNATLTAVDNHHQGTNEGYGGVRLSSDNLLVLVATDLGLLTYKYTTAAALRYIDTENTYTGGDGDVAIDFTGDNKLAFMSGSTGISWYTID